MSKKGSTSYTPQHLGKLSQQPVTKVDRIPWQGSEITVELTCNEFTSLCPVTKQPDFGTLAISYAPNEWLIETKSLKLYLWQFRDQGVFNEAIVDRIATDLHGQIKPQWIEVTGEFHSRGGIAIRASSRRNMFSGRAPRRPYYDDEDDDSLPF
ncbi:MAG: NADPH-dependent 7-cyano-7-deazaguanine reductase QueF [Lentisphaerae bacterium]|jgi:7-cyano-7-deazaguanine reductase|nr:NADPH-dependent 7-cyano-7-deazaguanine reductase QueF [Lentisphaerota bacterium]